MLVIRYFRIGKKNQPYFKIVVVDQRMPVRGGRFVEEVGFLDPVRKKRTINAERIKYWISKGAQPSDSVHNLLISEKIIEGKKKDVHNKKKVAEGTSVVPSAAPAAPVAAKSEEVKEAVKMETPVAPEPPKPEEPKAEAPKEEPKIDLSAEAPKEAKVEAPAEPARIATQSVAGGEKKIDPPAEEQKIEAPKE